MDVAMTVISLLATALGSFALFWLATMQKSVTEITKELANFRTNVAENYVKNTRLEQMEERLMERLDRIENRLMGGHD